MAILKIRQQDGTWAIVNDPNAVKHIEQELTEAQKAQARVNIGAAKTISSANIPYVDGGGYPIGALEAYNQVDSTKQNLPVTVADIKTMLNNFPLNLAEMQRAMYAGSCSGEQGCMGVLPISREASLLGSFTDLPLFTTAPQKVSIAVRKDTGTLTVGDPISEDDATTKKYVDDAVNSKLDKPSSIPTYPKLLTINNGITGTLYIDNVVTTNVINQKASGNVIATYRNPVASDTLAGYQKVLISGEPVAPSHVATKNYIDTNFIAKTAESQTITGNLAITGNLQVQGTTETVDAVTYKIENNVIEFNSDKIYNETWLTGLAINRGLDGETDLGTYGIMYDPSTDAVKLGFGQVNEENKFKFNENESAPIATREEFDDSWEEDEIFVFDKATKKFKHSGKTLSSFKEEIQDEMKTYMAQFVAEYVKNYMSSETIVYPDGTTIETDSDILFANGTITEIDDEDGSATLYVEEE